MNTKMSMKNQIFYITCYKSFSRHDLFTFYLKFLKDRIIDFNEIQKLQSDELDKVHSVIDMKLFRGFVERSQKLDEYYN